MAAINIGNKIDKEAAGQLIEGIIAILRITYETRADRETIAKALDTLQHLGGSTNHINNCVFHGKVMENDDAS